MDGLRIMYMHAHTNHFLRPMRCKNRTRSLWAHLVSFYMKISTRNSSKCIHKWHTMLGHARNVEQGNIREATKRILLPNRLIHNRKRFDMRFIPSHKISDTASPLKIWISYKWQVNELRHIGSTTQWSKWNKKQKLDWIFISFTMLQFEILTNVNWQTLLRMISTGAIWIEIILIRCYCKVCQVNSM